MVTGNFPCMRVAPIDLFREPCRDQLVPADCVVPGAVVLCWLWPWPWRCCCWLAVALLPAQSLLAGNVLVAYAPRGLVRRLALVAIIAFTESPSSRVDRFDRLLPLHEPPPPLFWVGRAWHLGMTFFGGRPHPLPQWNASGRPTSFLAQRGHEPAPTGREGTLARPRLLRPPDWRDAATTCRTRVHLLATEPGFWRGVPWLGQAPSVDADISLISGCGAGCVLTNDDLPLAASSRSSRSAGRR
jgi:hypothetical protein